MGESRPECRSHRQTIERAATAIDDIDAAASFVETVGTPRLRQALESSDEEVDRAFLRDGQRALAAFERFRRAASRNDGNFHPGHGIPLREEGQASDI